jgi:hypothetical protein
LIDPGLVGDRVYCLGEQCETGLAPLGQDVVEAQQCDTRPISIAHRLVREVSQFPVGLLAAAVDVSRPGSDQPGFEAGALFNGCPGEAVG